MVIHVFQLDERDFEILTELKNNSKQSLGKIAKKLDIPKSSVYRKITKLEENGLIRHYSIRIDYQKLGKPILAYILISIESSVSGKTQKEIAMEIAQFPAIHEIHITTGDYDMIAKVRAKSVEDLGEIVINKIRNVKGVGKTYSIVTLQILPEETNIVRV
jgi:DNA-binding Lrp family transcriptional regulator